MQSQIHVSKKNRLLILTLFLSGAVYAQGNQLQVIFESESGVQWVSATQDTLHHILSEGNTLDDGDGDGVPDLIMRTEDAQGNLQDLLVVAVNEARPRVIWRVDNVQATLDLRDDVQFIGFADPFGSGVPHGIFSGNGIYLFDPRDNALSWFDDIADGPVELAGVLDLTGDAIPDLLISLPTLQKVQVWSIHP